MSQCLFDGKLDWLAASFPLLKRLSLYCEDSSRPYGVELLCSAMIGLTNLRHLKLHEHKTMTGMELAAVLQPLEQLSSLTLRCMELLDSLEPLKALPLRRSPTSIHISEQCCWFMVQALARFGSGSRGWFKWFSSVHEKRRKLVLVLLT